MHAKHITVVAVVALVCACGYAQRPSTPATTTIAAYAPPLWQLRSKHFVYGMPTAVDDRHAVVLRGQRLPGISVLVREGFVVGHYDRSKVPAWVMMRWTEKDYRASEAEPYKERDFEPDPELPAYARAGRNYDHATSRMERGHMARHEDNKAWGPDNVDLGCLMSNIVPQHEKLNGEAWLDLEEMHRSVVANPASGIKAVWVISGPVFEDNKPKMTVGNGVGVPHATYKVIGWFDKGGKFRVRAYVVRQEDRLRDPKRYLRSVDEVERLTGLDFFMDLEDGLEQHLESAMLTALWN